MNIPTESGLGVARGAGQCSRAEPVQHVMEAEPVKKRRFLRLPQVLEILPISKSTWWKGIQEGRFPKPVKLTERTSAWLLDDIEVLCDKLVSSRIERTTNEGKCV
jgi:prophage regulatory protein